MWEARLECYERAIDDLIVVADRVRIADAPHFAYSRIYQLAQVLRHQLAEYRVTWDPAAIRQALARFERDPWHLNPRMRAEAEALRNTLTALKSDLPAPELHVTDAPPPGVTIQRVRENKTVGR